MRKGSRGRRIFRTYKKSVITCKVVDKNDNIQTVDATIYGGDTVPKTMELVKEWAGKNEYEIVKMLDRKDSEVVLWITEAQFVQNAIFNLEGEQNE